VPSDETLPGEMAVPPTQSVEDSHPLVAEDVIATYVADAVRCVPGITHLHGTAWQELSQKVHIAAPSKGVTIREVAPGEIEVDVHVSVAWCTVIPELAAAVQAAVAQKVNTMLDLTVRKTTVFVDEVDAPPEFD